MRNDLTESISTASAWARIYALVIHAGFIRSTVGVHYALRTTAFVRITEVLRQAGTRSGIVLLFTYSVSPAW